MESTIGAVVVTREEALFESSAASSFPILSKTGGSVGSVASVDGSVASVDGSVASVGSVISVLTSTVGVMSTQRTRMLVLVLVYVPVFVPFFVPVFVPPGVLVLLVVRDGVLVR